MISKQSAAFFRVTNLVPLSEGILGNKLCTQKALGIVVHRVLDAVRSYDAYLADHNHIDVHAQRRIRTNDSIAKRCNLDLKTCRDWSCGLEHFFVSPLDFFLVS